MDQNFYLEVVAMLSFFFRIIWPLIMTNIISSISVCVITYQDTAWSYKVRHHLVFFFELFVYKLWYTIHQNKGKCHSFKSFKSFYMCTTCKLLHIICKSHIHVHHRIIIVSWRCSVDAPASRSSSLGSSPGQGHCLYLMQFLQR